jgi:hypothetical protein
MLHARKMRGFTNRRYSIRRDLRRIWNNTGIADIYQPASKFLESGFDLGLETSIDENNFGVFNWIMIIEEFSFTFSLCYMAVDEGNLPENRERLVFKFMIGALAGHLNALRCLVLKGFDVHARIVLRPVSEHIDLMMAMAIQPSLCEEYHAATNINGENDFWHKHVSNGKLRKKLIRAVAGESEILLTAWRECDRYVQSEGSMAGIAIHPSFLSSAMICSMGMSHGKGGFGFFGVVDAASERTLKFVVYRLFELMIVSCDNIRKNCLSCFAQGLPYTEKELSDRISYITALSAYICINQDNISALRSTSPTEV